MPVNKQKKEFERLSEEYGTHVLRFDTFFDTLHQISDETQKRRTFENLTNLLKDNRYFFANTVFGRKQDFRATDSANRQLFVWQASLTHCDLWIITAKERGTSYEIILKNGISKEYVETNELDFTNQDLLEKAKKEVYQYLDRLFIFNDDESLTNLTVLSNRKTVSSATNNDVRSTDNDSLLTKVYNKVMSWL